MGGEHRSSGGSPRSVEIQRGERVWDASTPTTMDAVEELTQLSESMRQVASLLADDDPCDDSAPRRLSTFVNAVALGNVVGCNVMNEIAKSALKSDYNNLNIVSGLNCMG
ncbi:Os10g0185200 [Oryza sativa Japonica Group]|uniref:Os10g0185200 protein n=1 Tax=Oryza sativa subsp. japonica TaxID=39947 RepID=Q0IYP1_ORYSJ|nr:Os10g0185200 [Oryza sativa Japonica Group]|eukprot:NP_001064260.2 Os10g0185200 [Oryza sativa Japonica Group]